MLVLIENQGFNFGKIGNYVTALKLRYRLPAITTPREIIVL